MDSVNNVVNKKLSDVSDCNVNDGIPVVLSRFQWTEISPEKVVTFYI